MKINLNDIVKVKLTEHGKNIYYHRYDSISNPKVYGILHKYPKVDEEGYTRMQLWDFMQAYGPYIGLAMPNVIEPLDIIVKEE